MSCPNCQQRYRVFDQRTAENELKSYRRKGPGNTTRLLVDALRSYGVQGLTLLDIGGGVGAIQHELLKSDVRQVQAVDASLPYLEADRQEAERLGHAGQVTYQYGNFVDLAEQIPPADIVTLEKVICCYPDMHALVRLSAAHARQYYGVVFPRDTWWMRLGARLGNFFLRLQRNAFRFFVHPTQDVEAMIQASGLQRKFYCQTFLWQVIVYGRERSGD